MEEKKVKIASSRFGAIEIPEAQVYVFPEGILGFAEIKRYAVMQNPNGGPFQWLHAVEQPSLAFVVCDPLLVCPEYKISVRKDDLRTIKLDDISTGVVLVIITIPRDPKEMTANLQGPVIFNPIEKLAKQIVLNDPTYPVRFRVMIAARKDEPNAGSDKTN